MAYLYWRDERREWWARKRLPDGKRISAFAGHSKPEAQRFLKAWEAGIDALPPPAPVIDGPTVAQAAEDWLKRKAHLRDVRHYRGALGKWVLPTLGERPAKAVKRADVRALLDAMRADPKVADKTIRNVYGVMRAFFGSLEADEIIDRTPCLVPRGDLPSAAPRDPGFRGKAVFTHPEVERLLSATEVPEHWRAFWALLFFTGARLSEALELRWSDFERDVEPLGRITISRAGSGRTKTDRDREVPVHPELARALERWRTHGFARHVGRLPAPNDWLVPTAKGTRQHPTQAWRRWRKHLVALELRPRRIHDARRTFISLALADGARKDVLRRVTHSGNADVFDAYTTLPWAALCEAVSVLRLHVREPGDVIPLGTTSEPARRLLSDDRR